MRIREIRTNALLEFMKYVNKGSKDKEVINKSAEMIIDICDLCKVKRITDLYSVRLVLKDKLGLDIPAKQYRKDNCPKELVL